MYVVYCIDMNYYERIGRSIVFIENHLDEDFSVEYAAREACMSMSNFYRMFLSIAGFTVKEYVRRRRLACAAAALCTEPESRVIDIAIKYGYTSADGFSRSFRDEFGLKPSEMKAHFVAVGVEGSRKKLRIKGLRRINIMDEYFELNDKELLEQYPDIKLLKKLPQMKVACFKYFGPDPETHAFANMKEWIRQNGIRFNAKDENGESAYRIFGFNNPDPSLPGSDEAYGYEVCVTIDQDLYQTLKDAPVYGEHENYSEVMRKVLPGGMYAVVSIKRDGDGDIGTNIMRGWQRFAKWMELSKYIWGGQQYLEEHLGFSDDDEHTGGVDLYMPVQEPPLGHLCQEPAPETIPACRVAYYRATNDDGEKAAMEAWQIILTFAKKNKLASDSRVFMYGSGFSKTPPFFHEIMITLSGEFTFTDPLVKEKKFTGGRYRTVVTDPAHQLATWGTMEQWCKETKTRVGGHQWVAEWYLDDWNFPAKSIKVCFPVTQVSKDA